MVLLDTGTPGTSREIYSEDAVTSREIYSEDAVEIYSEDNASMLFERKRS